MELPNSLRRLAMAWCCVAVLGTLGACGGGGGGEALDADPAPDPGAGANAGSQYFPMAVGDRWVYRTWSGNAEADFQLKLVKATGAATVLGREAVVLRSIRALDGFVENVRYMAVTSGGVTELSDPSSMQGGPPIPALDQLRFPLVAGSSYEQLSRTFDLGADYDGDGRHESLHIASSVSVVGFESAQTDAGHFANAAHVRTAVTRTGTYSSGLAPVVATVTVDSWYVEGIGLVREDIVTRSPGALTTIDHSTLVSHSVGGVRSDTVSPSATLVAPSTDGVRGPFTHVQIRYSEPMDVSTVDARAIELRDSAGVIVPVNVSGEGADFSFYSAESSLQTGTHTVSVSSSALDLLGNPAAPASWSFYVDATAPVVVATSPADEAKYVPVDAIMTIDLSEEIDPAGVSGRVNLIGATYLPVDVSIEGRRITVKPLAPLTPRTQYTLQAGSFQDKTGNVMTTGLSISFQTDPGQFDYAQEMAIANSPEAVAVGDVNGDGRNDVITTNWFNFTPTTDYKLFVLPQQPDGTLGSPVAYSTQSTFSCGPTSVAVADVNADGRRDVIVGESGCGIEVFLQDATGGLVSIGVFSSPESHKIRAADLDGDGQVEIVGVGWGTGRVAIWKSTAGGVLTGPNLYALEHFGGEDLDIGDINGDARPDIVVTSTQLDASKALAILQQQSDGRFGNPLYRSLGGGWARSVAVGDVNGDGRGDVVVGRSTDSLITVFYQDASGNLGSVRDSAADGIVGAVEVADLDNDGVLEIIVESGFGFGVYGQQENGTLGEIRSYQAYIGNQFNPQAIATGDINGDGFPDLVGAGVGYVLNRGPLPASPSSAGASKMRSMFGGVRISVFEAGE